MKYSFFLILLMGLLFTSCIGDDIINDRVDTRLLIDNPLDTLEFGGTYQFNSIYLNNVGQAEELEVNWITSNPLIVSIDSSGMVTALDSGTVTITVSGEDAEGNALSDEDTFVVGESTVATSFNRTGVVSTTSSYDLSGAFKLEKVGTGVRLEFFDDYNASSSLPGLYIYLTNNPTTTSGALEIGAVTVFSGAHSYDIADVGLNDFSHVLYFCKPFNAKVGDGLIND